MSDDDHDPDDAEAAAWWESLDAQLAAAEEAAPDPWAGAALPPADLTSGQAEFLAGLADQPAPPRLTSPDPYGLTD